ncbi:MAG: phospholipid carrier-dependent glycosyltransferase [Syntrophaceae bacterium]|nr:phospholipid carrier-dependent glycosyltransferase [Pseudomonadota bacterium]MCG2741455.1 phospholipid carrier-dependent glycosyltransferase [Syntrophaceae bacterium]
MNIDLLYLISLYFNNDILPNFIHMGFGIGTAWIIYRYLNRHFTRVAGLLGVLVFVSTPIVLRMSTVAYVDLGLAFFTTVSVLAFIHWRTGSYEGFKWLLISSIAMGLALGTKYNALIAWVFLSFSVVFLYSRDTGEQWRAIRYGLIFFLVSLCLFSPWLIKNLILTGNPLYPLFKGLFTAGINNVAPDGSARSMVSGAVYMGMFRLREMLYGESFWETLLIPVRFFFQGEDYSGRYFNGVLNPILILLVPFAFMKRSLHGDKLFFVLFSVFFILASFFLDQLHIRYILPAIPFLAILTVMGIMNIFAWTSEKRGPSRSVYVSIILLFLLMLGAGNVIYLNKYFQGLQPANYVLNLETRDAYLKRHIRSYAAIGYINSHTPPNARIRLLFLARRGYYLNRIYEDDATYGMDVMRGLAANAGEEGSFRKYLGSLGCTHLLIRMDLFNKFLRDNYPPETIDLLLRLLDTKTEMIYHADGYAVYRLIPPM